MGLVGRRRSRGARDYEGAGLGLVLNCGHIEEMHEGNVVQSLTKKLSRRGFVADRATIEIQGLCASCAAS